jgi:hypothetical protein
VVHSLEAAMHVPNINEITALKMETVVSEMLVSIHKSTWSYNPGKPT